MAIETISSTKLTPVTRNYLDNKSIFFEHKDVFEGDIRMDENATLVVNPTRSRYTQETKDRTRACGKK